MTISGELDSSTAWGIGGSVERDNPDSAIGIENMFSFRKQGLHF